MPIYIRIYEPSSHLHIIYTYLYDILCLDTYIHRSHISFNCCIHGSQTCAQDLILRGENRINGDLPSCRKLRGVDLPTDPCSGKNDLKQSRMDYCIYTILFTYIIYIYIIKYRYRSSVLQSSPLLLFKYCMLLLLCCNIHSIIGCLQVFL